MTCLEMSINKKHIADAFGRAAVSYNDAAILQRRVGAFLWAYFDGLSGFNSALDVGCGTGALTVQLASFADRVTALDLSQDMLSFAQQKDEQNRIADFVCADAERMPFSKHSFDLIFSSFALQWCDDLASVFSSVYSLLQPGGRFVFAIPVDSTLWELKSSWHQADAHHAHVNDFPVAESIRNALKLAGFDIQCWDEKTDVMHYEKVNDLMAELKVLGAHQVVGQRRTALTGKTIFKNMLQAYEQHRDSNGLLPASWHWLGVMAVKKHEHK